VVDGPIRAFVQTRGTARATDYAFLGGAPPQPWWRAYRDATAFDHPTVLITSDGARWAAYLSGVPSARVDAVGTVVRYTLVLDGPCGAPDGACVAAAVAAWLDDVAAGASGRLSAALDAQFPPDDVQRWLAHTDERHVGRIGSDGSAVRQIDAASASRAVTAEVRRRALAALAVLPAPSPAADEPGSWLGAVRAPAARRAFTSRVAALVAGLPGRALLLNLVGGPDDTAALLDPDSPAAVLVDGSAPTHLTPLRAEVEAKKAPAAASSRPTRRAGVAAVAGIAVLPLAAAATVLVLVALVVVLVLVF
jgi:hypothetical protein